MFLVMIHALYSLFSVVLLIKLFFASMSSFAVKTPIAIIYFVLIFCFIFCDSHSKFQKSFFLFILFYTFKLVNTFQLYGMFVCVFVYVHMCM